MEKVTELAFKLHDLLLSSEQYLNLKVAEDNMNNDENASLLIQNYHKLQELSHNNKMEELNKKLHEAKLKMDLNPYVIEYKKAYKEYQILVGKITSIVFKDFSTISTLDKILKSR